MHHSTYRPRGPLGNYVDVFWQCIGAPPHPKAIVLPNGTIELVINLGDDEIRIYDVQPPAHSQRFPGVVVAGAHARAFVVDPSQRRSIMGVHFRPGGAFPFFGPAIGELVSRHLALEDLWGTEAAALRDRLCATSNPQGRFQILEETLTSRLRWNSEHPAVSLALNYFGPAGIGGSVRAVAERIGLSQRRLIQVFTTQVGLTPKLFCRVLRFKHAREFVDQARLIDWSQIAQGCGYYDQSHLIHDFQELSGLSPTEYLRLPESPLTRNHVRPLDKVNFFQDPVRRLR